MKKRPHNKKIPVSEPSPEELAEAIGSTRTGRDTGDLLETGVTEKPGEVGTTGEVGLSEAEEQERLKEENSEEREYRTVPGDLLSIGSQDAGDEGIPGGFAAGGEESLGGTGGIEREAEDINLEYIPITNSHNKKKEDFRESKRAA